MKFLDENGLEYFLGNIRIEFATAQQGVLADSALQTVPNATHLAVGGLKVRFDSATSTLYITNDGTNP